MVSAERLDVSGYDEVWRVDCAGAVAHVALHAVLGGHAFGGIRIREYADEAAARDDALALSRAMSRKLALAGIVGGGGKCVLMAPGPGLDRSACVAALGEFITSLEGRYCCGPDLGFTAADDVALQSTTSHVASSGLSAATATSVLDCLLAACPDVGRVAVQGVGSVGRPLADALLARGVEVVVCDPDPARVDGLPSVPLESIYDVEADVFAPCAAGAILDQDTIPRLRCRVVCGGANNPFAREQDIERLDARGIAIVPDIVANAGATVVGASHQLDQSERIPERMTALAALAAELLERAGREGRSAQRVAIDVADERIAAQRGA